MYKIYLLLILSLFIFLFSNAETVKVKWIIDGDTFLTDKDQKVRMLGINATERDEKHYNEAKKALIKKIKGETVELIPDNQSPLTDQYGRLLRYVELDGRDINKEMISEGLVYAFLRYPVDRAESYKEAENNAKASQAGIWSSASQDDVPSKNKNLTWILTAFVIALIALRFYLKFRQQQR